MSRDLVRRSCSVHVALPGNKTASISLGSITRENRYTDAGVLAIVAGLSPILEEDVSRVRLTETYDLSS